MPEFSDNELLLKIKSENQSAFEVIFLRYYARLCSYAESILGNKDASEEIVQDLFVKFWETRNQIDINTSLKAYLYRTVHNQCLNYIESLKVRSHYTRNKVQELENYNTIPFTSEYPIANLIVQELEEKINDSINALPQQCREVFVLIRFNNKSYQEVASILNISLNTVKTQMQRAVSKMKDSLQEYLPTIFLILSTLI